MITDYMAVLPKFVRLDSNPLCDGIGGGVFRRWWGQEGGARMNAVSVSHQETGEFASCFPCSPPREDTAQEVGRRLSPETKSADTVILAFFSPMNCER